jgi:hypothetical protein
MAALGDEGRPSATNGKSCATHKGGDKEDGGVMA